MPALISGGSITAHDFKAMVDSGQIHYDEKKKKWVSAGSKGGVSKYRNKITEVDGRKFDSQAEASHYLYLKQQKAAGLIADFECQKRFVICDQVLNDDGSIYSKRIDYIADFVITHIGGDIEVVDVKGMILDLYELKRAVLYQRYGLKITEVFKGNTPQKRKKRTPK